MGLNNQQKGGSRSQKKSSDTKKIPSAIRWDFFLQKFLCSQKLKIDCVKKIFKNLVIKFQLVHIQ